MENSGIPPSFVRQPATLGTSHVRILFALVQDDQGYPPATSETLWALPIRGSRYRLDNIPFFVCGVSCFDIVDASADESGFLRFGGLVESAGHSTIRVIFYDQKDQSLSIPERVAELRNGLRSLGCSSEVSHIPGLISVDVPPEVPLRVVKSVLEDGVALGYWDYEEATVFGD